MALPGIDVVCYLELFCFTLAKTSGQANVSKLSPLTHKFANLGAAGKFPNNIERDLSSLLKLPVTPVWINIPIRSATDRATLETMKVPLVLPHEMYHYLYEPWQPGVPNLVLFFFGTLLVSIVWGNEPQ